MKRIISLIATIGLIFMMVPAVSAEEIPTVSPFADVSVGSEFFPYVYGLYNEHVVGGLGGNYYPLNNVTRAEMAKMAVNGAGVEVDVCSGAPHFNDVPVTHSLYNFVETAYCNGIVQGRSPGVFAPDAPVLRQEAMKIVIGTFRTADVNGYFTEDLTGAPHFSDVLPTSEFYKYIETGYNLGIISGYGNGKFGPMDYMRRDQMAKVVYNSMKVLRGETITPEEGYKLKLGASATSVRNDGTSLVEITASVEMKVEGIWVTDDNWEEPVKFATDLGEFEDGDDEYTESADEGRAHATLRASTEEGTATITVKTGDLEAQTIQVEFSSAAPSAHKGFGSASIAGVGKIELYITDDNILIDDGATASFMGSFPPVRYGNSTVEVYIYDTDMIPVSGDDVICTIVEGDGVLTPTPVPNAAAVSFPSITMDPEDNGRYTGNYVVTENASEDNVQIRCYDYDTSPSLVVEAGLTTNNLTIEAWANQDELVTRNTTQVTGGTAIIQNVATLFARLNDENGDPVQLNTATTFHNVKATIIDGADAGVELWGASGIDDNQVDAYELEDADGNIIPGFYTVQFVSGTAEGDVTIEFSDTGAIGAMPTAEVEISVYSPTFEVFKSADKAGEWVAADTVADNNGHGSTLIVKVVDNDDVPLFDETVCVKIVSDAGTGSVVFSNTGAGNCTGAGAQQLDWVGDTGILAGNQTGFYSAQYYAPTNVSKSDTADLEFYNNYDRTDIDSETDAIDVQKTATPNNDIDDINILPLETIIGPDEYVPVIIFAQDDEGLGVETAADGVFDPSFGVDNPEIKVEAIQNGDVDVSFVDSPLYELYAFDEGFGAYYTAFTAYTVAGTKGEMQITGKSQDPQVQLRQQFNIVDATIELELLRDEVVTDEGLGALIYVYDHNDDPVIGLAADTNVNPPSGGNIDVNPTGVEELYDVIYGGIIPGSGVYDFSLDTLEDINEGAYTVNVSTVVGRLVKDTDTFEVVQPTVEVICHPDFVVSSNTIVCTVVVRDEDGDPIDVPTDFVRVTTNVGAVEDDNDTATAGAKVDTLTRFNGDGINYFTFEGGNLEDTADVTAQLWSTAVGVTPPAGAKLLDSQTISLDIR